MYMLMRINCEKNWYTVDVKARMPLTKLDAPLRGLETKYRHEFTYNGIKCNYCRRASNWYCIITVSKLLKYTVHCTCTVHVYCTSISVVQYLSVYCT